MLSSSAKERVWAFGYHEIFEDQRRRNLHDAVVREPQSDLAPRPKIIQNGLEAGLVATVYAGSLLHIGAPALYAQDVHKFIVTGLYSRKQYNHVRFQSTSGL